jgi:hypothetical protein
MDNIRKKMQSLKVNDKKKFSRFAPIYVWSMAVTNMKSLKGTVAWDCFDKDVGPVEHKNSELNCKKLKQR